MPEIVLDQSFPASLEAYDLQVFCMSDPGDGSYGCVHAWGVAARGDYPDSFQLFDTPWLLRTLCKS
jgi:hypothetical protein